MDLDHALLLDYPKRFGKMVTGHNRIFARIQDNIVELVTDYGILSYQIENFKSVISNVKQINDSLF